jgi:hypothetical protein
MSTPQKTVVIDGYFKDDKTEFSGYLCAIGLDIRENDDDIFFYFEDGEKILGEHNDFVVTSVIH